MDFETFASFVASLKPETARNDALTQLVREQAAAIASSDSPVEAFGRVVEGVREDKLRFEREAEVCREAIPVLTMWQDVREAAVKDVYAAELVAAQVAIDAINTKRAEEIAAVNARRDGDIVAILDMIDAEPVCGLFRAVARDDMERSLVTIQESIRHVDGWTGKDMETVVFDTGREGRNRGKFVEAPRTSFSVAVGVMVNGILKRVR